MERISLCRDLVRNPRDCEDSRIVVSKWGSATDAFLPEITPASNAQYFNLTAERLLYRDKLLLLSIDQALAECETIQSARPFGPSGPNFAKLRDASVRMAMAFVPLTPAGGNGKAVLARLYCVAGLPEKNKPPFAEGGDSPDIDKYSWFVAGVPAVFEGEALSGRSWLLAANLLMKIIEKKDQATSRNLAANFIVTGDVDNSTVKEVGMGRKPELAEINEYRNYKWIVPMNNASQMSNVPSRKIETPATLDEAYSLIETMQNEATRALFRFLKMSDLRGMKGQRERGGADIFAEDEATGKMPLQIITEMIQDTRNVIASNTDANLRESEELLNKQLEIKQWLKMQEADCTMMFYLLAALNMEQSLAECSKRLSINAQDESGLNAIDWALMAENRDAAIMLHKYGGNCNVADVSCCRNRKLRRAIGNRGHESEAQFKLLETAMEVGLSPNVLMSDSIWYPDEEDCRTMGSLFGMALCLGDLRVIKLCLQNGADPNAALEFKIKEASWDYSHVSFSRFSSALELLYKRDEMTHCLCLESTLSEIANLLIKYGGRITDAVKIARGERGVM